MNQYFRYFGIMDKLKIKRLDDAAFDTIYYKGKNRIMQWDTRSLLKPSAVPSRMRKKT